MIESGSVISSRSRRADPFSSARRVLALLLSIAFLACGVASNAIAEDAPQAPAAGPQREWIVYGGRISSEATWQDIVAAPRNAEWTQTWLAVAGYIEHTNWTLWGFEWEREFQVARYFGDQDNWEFNAVPVVARWTRMPFRDRVASSIAFGLGLSYATEVPPVEVELEGASERLLVYWMLEFALSPPDADWAVSMRIHHRSGAFGLFTNDGGMNAITLGLRRRF